MNIDSTSKISYQGAPGAFSEQAAKELFGDGIMYIPCKTFEDVLKNIELERTKYGIIPVENSIIGAINDNYDLVSKKRISVIDKIRLSINHCLIALKGSVYKDISKVYSHPAALAQCSIFLRSNPGFESISYYDTAGSVKMIKEKGLFNSAAIASKLAAIKYDMKIYKESIQDNKNNVTLFYVLEKAYKQNYRID